jgi:prevent-host-death family protein
MKEISINELQKNAEQWVQRAAKKEPVVITRNGQPIATLSAFDASQLAKPLPEREKRIRKRSLIKVDSADYISEMRG